MSDTDEKRAALLAMAWAEIKRRKDTRLWGLATVDANGRPTSRSIVLRAADQGRAALQFHTDARSAKVAELTARPQAGLLCWLPHLDLQIRMQVTAQILTGEAVRPIWNLVPDGSRGAYGVVPAPATPIADPLGYNSRADFDGFALLDMVVDQIDLLQLGQDHQRAVYSRDDDWTGQWVAP